VIKTNETEKIYDKLATSKKGEHDESIIFYAGLINR